MTESELPRRQLVADLALVFLELGTIAFGGPAAQIALMEREFVNRHGWLSREEFLDLLGVGLINTLWASVRRSTPRSSAALMLGAGGIAASSSAVFPVTLTKLFLIFAKVGAMVFGSGYVLLAYLRADFVGGTHWLTETQLLDAVAVGQVTPGPVFTTATFIGYVVAGPLGAAVATLGIFLPSFVFVAASGPLIPRLRRSPLAAAFLDGVNVSAVGVILVVGVQLARTALVDVTTVLLAAVGFVALVRLRVNSAWLVAAGGLVGLAHVWLGP